jgi:hypothetical protein
MVFTPIARNHGSQSSAHLYAAGAQDYLLRKAVLDEAIQRRCAADDAIADALTGDHNTVVDFLIVRALRSPFAPPEPKPYQPYGWQSEDYPF